MWGTLNSRVMWKTHIHWKNCKTALKMNLKAFQNNYANVCWEIFSEVLRSWRFTLKDCALEKGKLNCWRKIGSKFLTLYVIKLPWQLPCSGTWLLGCSILLSCCRRLLTILKISGFVIKEVWCFCQNLMFW